ncbi:MAG: peptide ABC transporter substrate-binding protein [Thermomicrobiales bacterium]
MAMDVDIRARFDDSPKDDEAKRTSTSIDRRKVLKGAAGATAAAVAGARLIPAAAARGYHSFNPLLNALQELPADAAAPESQVYIAPDNVETAKVLDFYESVYTRPSDAASDLFSEPLVRLDKNFELQPAAAESWSGSKDGKTWTFKIRQGMVWSDGNPVTANDWVKTLQYGADPQHAWDFTWYFQGVIKGWDDAIAGKIPLEELGVKKGADDYELIFETQVPAPYLPAMLLYSNPLSKAALESTGPLYNTKPETAVSSGPFILSEWTLQQEIIYTKNEKYDGTLKVPVNKIQIKLASPDTYFQMYENDEVDFQNKPAPSDLTVMQSDPEKAKEIHSGVGDFRTFYIFFDVTKDPFKDLKVRQAWSHAIDRDTLQKQVLGPGGTPAYSWLAPGFPASNRDGLKDIQAYDPEKGKSLLAEAGFQDGKGFPKQQMWLRAPNPLDKTVAGALASMIKQNLNIDVELVVKDSAGYMASLTAKPTEILLGYVSYGMDFFDPTNMLSVWKSGGRHSWSNADFDKGLADASAYLGDPAERIKMFQNVEKILVSDVPGVFVYHETPVQLIKPWLKGEFLTPDENGISAMHWPGYATMSTVPQDLYIGKDAPSR